MALNHLEYHKRLTRLIPTKLKEFPAGWKLEREPEWVIEVIEVCEKLDNEIDEAYASIKASRRMVRQIYHEHIDLTLTYTF